MIMDLTDKKSNVHILFNSDVVSGTLVELRNDKWTHLQGLVRDLDYSTWRTCLNEYDPETQDLLQGITTQQRSTMRKLMRYKTKLIITIRPNGKLSVNML